MDIQDLTERLQTHFPDAQIDVHGDGVHFEASLIDPQFEGVSLVARQQKVYACVQDEIASGQLHALSLKTYTPAEWAAKQ